MEGGVDGRVELWAITCRPQAAQRGIARTTTESTNASLY